MEGGSKALTPGTKLGNFVVSELLGVGGMGEVYRARDTKLERDVAIKVLPDSLAANPDGIARFRREARLLASLNHPGIASIYGFDETNSARFIVLELVEGETLADRLRRGALPVEEALDIGTQVAEALEAAHAGGVIHRDLKPANVKIAADGKVKVLDFGLAKALSDERPAPSSTAALADSPTRTVDSPASSPISEMATQEGVLLGTAPYMSPEQARGKAVDKRSDVWSFGCVLYECLSGKLLFGGESVADTVGAILHKEPEWGPLPEHTPPTVQLLLRRCLAKDRKQRLHDIADARIELETALADPTSSLLGLAGDPVPESSDRLARRRLISVALLSVAVLLTAVTTYLVTTSRRTPAPQSPSVRLVIPSRTSTYYGASGGVISPDGRRIVFPAYETGSAESRLWVRSLDSFDARPIEGIAHFDFYPDTGIQAGWSGDGGSIFYHRAGKLWSTRIDGSVPKLIAGVPESLGITCNRDGVILLSRGEGGVCRVPVSGGEVEVITALDKARNETAHVFPHFLSDGKRFLFLGLDFDPESEVRSRRLYAGTLDAPEITFVSELSSRVAYVEPGFLVYVEGGAIFARPFDASRLEFTGKARLLADSVFYFEPTGAAALSVARQGTIVFKAPSPGEMLVWFDKTGQRLETVGNRRRYRSIRISHDGKRCLAGVENSGTRASDLWVFGLERQTTTQLTSDTRFESDGIWAHDDSTIFYSSDVHGWPDVFKMPADGSGPSEEVHRAPGQWFPQDVSPGGDFLILVGARPGEPFDLAVLPLEGEGELRPFRPTPAEEYWARFSPDGQCRAPDPRRKPAVSSVFPDQTWRIIVERV